MEPPLEPSRLNHAAPRHGELLRALGVLFGGTLLLLVGQLAWPPLAGLSQLGLAFLLLRAPGWVLPRIPAAAGTEAEGTGHSRPDEPGAEPDDRPDGAAGRHGRPEGHPRATDGETLGCAFAWGPIGRGLRVAGLTLAAVTLPFFIGFHLLQRDVLGRPLDWSLTHLPRWNLGFWAAPDDLELAPPTVCGRAETVVWTQPGTLWLVAPSDAGLRVTGPDVPARPLRCSRGGRPVVSGQPAGSHRQAAAASDRGVRTHVLPPGAGLVLTLGDLETLDLRLEDPQGQPLPAAAIRLGARGVTPSDDGRVHASRDLWWLLVFVAVQLGLVALPEEHFFRGYLQGRLDLRWGTPWRLLGVPVGWGLPATALAFALLHPILIPGVSRLLVFFPALLFGWLRAREGSLGAAVIVHAGCNLLLAVASRMVGQLPTT
jgi:membrane protease YdiL (CAAX protease family)